MKKYISFIPPIILTIGAIIRIVGVGASAIWFDEANTLHRTGIPFLTLFSEHSENSGDLLLELILRPLMAMSHSIWILRLPSIIAGMVSLWLVWKLMQWFKFNILQQICSAVLVSFLPGLIWIGQDARAYGLLACLCLATLWFALNSRWLGMTAACGLIIYCHSTGPVYAVTALLLALYLYPNKYRKVAFSAIGITLAWVPAVTRILNTWIIQQPWAPQLRMDNLIRAVLQAFWTHASINIYFSIFAIFVMTCTMCLMLQKFTNRNQLVIAGTWLIPLSGLIAVSLITTNNMILYRTLMPMLFPFSIWLGSELGQLKFSYFRITLGALWLFMLAYGLKYWDPAARGAYLDRAAEQIQSMWEPGDVIVYTTFTVALPFEYYLGDYPSAWYGIISNPFLVNPVMPIEFTQDPNDFQRRWVIIPEDLLITNAEHKLLMGYVRNQDPVIRISYLQAAPIDIYLVEMP
jgi:hypothetical protein